MVSSAKWIQGIGPETMVADAARRSLEPRLAVVAHALPLAAYLADHDIEHVHRLRVATRRAAAAVKLYRDWLPPKTQRWFKKQLRRIRRAAGEARDLDVLIQRLQREPGSQAQADEVVKFLVARRRAVQPAIVELADELRQDDRFVHKAVGLFNKIGARGSDDEGDASLRFGDWAPRQLDKFRDAFVELLPKGSEDIAALHQFRIRAKALRYAIELLAPAFGPELRSEIYPQVEKLQERLGNITDHIAAIRLFAEWEAHSAEHPRLDESLLDREKAEEIKDLQDFHKWWAAEGVEMKLVQGGAWWGVS